MSAEVDVYSIANILKQEIDFFIPSYQRGYRWGEQEVRELLDDLYEFDLNKEKHHSKFYCLQPLVVKKMNIQSPRGRDQYEVIDGQQRLTTILILLLYLQKSEEDNEEFYNIDFETRKKCDEFFNKFKNKDYENVINDSNPDFYHITKAYEYIDNWFIDKEKNKTTANLRSIKSVIGDLLLGHSLNVCFIWYETDQDSVELFKNLNEGKIPLTDSELIKAQLLQSDKYKKKDSSEIPIHIRQQLDFIANEWDAIVSKLNDNEFWFFLNEKDKSPSNRMEFIFRLLVTKWRGLEDFNDSGMNQKHDLFITFSNYMKYKKQKLLEEKCKEEEIDIKLVNSIWQEVKAYFNILEEWYEDHTLYHLVGCYLIFNDSKTKRNSNCLYDLLDVKFHKLKTNKEFEYYLKSKIGEYLKQCTPRGAVGDNLTDEQKSNLLDRLHMFTYHNEDNVFLINVLTLFNIDTLISSEKENARFPFNLYKKEKTTSLEHIHPQTPQDLDKNEVLAQNWLDNLVKSLKQVIEIPNITDDESLIDHCKIAIAKGENMLNKMEEQNGFKEIKDTFVQETNSIYDYYNQLLQIKTGTVDFEDNLYNLALISKETNSQLNNKFYPKKRTLLKKCNKYVPICTQRAFSKYYSNDASNLVTWDLKDRQNYFEAIKSVVKKYVDASNNQKYTLISSKE